MKRAENKMKNFLLMLFGVAYLLSMIACSKSNSNNFSETVLSQQDVASEEKDESASTEANHLSDKPTTGDSEVFTEEEIAKAQKVAETYYEGTSFIVESIEYDNTNTLYTQYSAEYGKSNLITFTVKMIDSENPPRSIALERKDSKSEWEVLDEGY
jgi:hypothetical protein